MPSPVLAETYCMTSPPNLPLKNVLGQFCLTRSALEVGLSILLMATMMEHQRP